MQYFKKIIGAKYLKLFFLNSLSCFSTYIFSSFSLKGVFSNIGKQWFYCFATEICISPNLIQLHATKIDFPQTNH